METTYHAYSYNDQYSDYIVVVETTEEYIVKYTFGEGDKNLVEHCVNWTDMDCKNYMRSNSPIFTDTTIL